MMRRRAYTGALFAAPACVGLALFFLAPLGISLYYAFTASGTVSLANFVRVIESQAFRTAFGNTFRQLLVCLTILTAGGVSAALGLIYLKKYREKLVFFLLAIFLVPIAVPSSVVGIFVTDVFGATGVINGLRVRAGLAPYNFLDSEIAFWVLVGVYLWKNIGLAALLFYARIDAIPREITEAAHIDGAGALRRTWSVTLPQLPSAFLFVTVVGVWGVFKLSRESFLIFGDYPDAAAYGLQNFLTNHFQSANYGVLSAASTIFFVVLSMILLAAVVLDRAEEESNA